MSCLRSHQSGTEMTIPAISTPGVAQAQACPYRMARPHALSIGFMTTQHGTRYAYDWFYARLDNETQKGHS
jgi:hypothetical protein